MNSFNFLSLVLVTSEIFGSDIDEPVCTSRFDYDQKMLKKTILLEIELNNLRDLFSEQSLEIATLKKQLQEEKAARIFMEEKFRNVEDLISFDGTGATYIRWGRTSCPGNGTGMMYKGFAGGSQHNYQGAAATMLCLPEVPLWNIFDDREQDSNTVWGAEYEFHFRDMNRFFGKPLAQRDVPCSVCHTKRAAVWMIPGRNKCYDGWTLEYQGYLMAGRDDQHATEYVCVDDDPEALSGGLEDQNGRLLYFAEARCGSLRCPPYVNGRELTCAVCSK